MRARSFLSLTGAVWIALLAACSERTQTPQPPERSALVTPPGSAAPVADSQLLPATVEAYWTGAANCLVPAEQLDTVAAATLGVLQRYSEPSAKSFGGLRFSQQSRVLVDAFDDLTGNMSNSEIARLAAGCADAICAANRIFGAPQGLRLMYLYVRYRYNASHRADRNAIAWTAQELADILLALEDLPDATAPFYDQPERPLVREARADSIARLFPDTTGQVVAISSASSRVGIRAGTGWDAMPDPGRRAAMFHELAHDFFRQQRKLVDADGLWRQAMVADDMMRRRTGRATSLPSAYARSGPEEDFAESVAAYRYAPELILRRAPNRARLLRSWVFDGLSYESAAACDPSRSVSARAATEAFALIPDLELSTDAIALAVSQCQWLLRDDASRRRVTHGRLCIGREIYRNALQTSLRRQLAANDPVARAVLAARTANEPFLEYRFGSAGDDRIMALTDRRAVRACGPTCHEDGLIRR